MKIWIPYDPPNWNDYIRMERTNYNIANNLKQREKTIVGYYTRGKKWTGGYPITVEFIFHFRNKRKDVDNSRVKGVIDGLVSCGCIKNDNLNCIRRVEVDSAIDGKVGIEINLRNYIEKEINVGNEI